MASKGLRKLANKGTFQHFAIFLAPLKKGVKGYDKKRQSIIYFEMGSVNKMRTVYYMLVYRELFSQGKNRVIH